MAGVLGNWFQVIPYYRLGLLPVRKLGRGLRTRRSFGRQGGRQATGGQASRLLESSMESHLGEQRGRGGGRERDVGLVARITYLLRLITYNHNNNHDSTNTNNSDNQKKRPKKKNPKTTQILGI